MAGKPSQTREAVMMFPPFKTYFAINVSPCKTYFEANVPSCQTTKRAIDANVPCVKTYFNIVTYSKQVFSPCKTYFVTNVP